MSAGLAKLGHVAIDGTKMKANASKHNAMSHERMVKEEVRLKAEVEQLSAAAWNLEASEAAPSSGCRCPRCRRRVAVRPYRAALASWSLLRSLLFRGAVKRLDTP
jgi:hypothetical protein